MMEIGADGSFLHIFAGYMVRGKLGRQVLQKNEKRAYWSPVNLNCPQCKRHINVPSSAEGSMVNCSKCGHEFLCDREKLIPKKPFAKAKKAVSVHSPKDSCCRRLRLDFLQCFFRDGWDLFPFHAAAAPAEGVCPVFCLSCRRLDGLCWTQAQDCFHFAGGAGCRGDCFPAFRVSGQGESFPARRS